MASAIAFTDQLPILTERLVDTYAEVGTIGHLGQCALPNYEAVIASTEELRGLLYPGYRRRDGLHLGNLNYHVGNVIDKLYEALTAQITRALHHEAGRRRPLTPEQLSALEHLGREKALTFLEFLPGLRKILALDVEAAYAGDPACTSPDEVIFCYPGLEAITVYRLAHVLHELHVPLIPRMMTEWAHTKTGVDIHPGARIGKYFFIDHGTGVVIGQTCIIGDWVKLYQGVTLGALSFPNEGDESPVRGAKRHPTIEDQVVIYANASVLGGQTVIGHDSVIGSNVWITGSVAPHTTVSLDKPRLRVRTSPGHEFESDSNWTI